MTARHSPLFTLESGQSGLKIYTSGRDAAFGGLQIWWIGSTLRRQRLPRPLSEGEFRRSLERIWQKQD
jgi:hypothetical protein